MVLLYPAPPASGSTVTLLLPPPSHLEVAASQWNPEDFPSPRELPVDAFPFDEEVVKEVTGIDSRQSGEDSTERTGAEDGEVQPDGATREAELGKDGQTGPNPDAEAGEAATVVKQEAAPATISENGEVPEQVPTTTFSSKLEPARTFKPNATSTSAPASSSTQLTKAHYHPKVIALAKKLAEKKGMKLLVDGTRRSMLVRYTDEKERTAATTNATTSSTLGLRDTNTTPGPSSAFVLATVPPLQIQLKLASQDPTILPPGPAPNHSPMVEPIQAQPSTPLPRNNKKKGKGRWAGHIKAHSRADTPLKHVAPLAVAGSSPFPAGTSTPGPVVAGTSHSGAGAGEVDMMDDAARAIWEEEVFEKRRREFGMGIGSSSWWSVSVPIFRRLLCTKSRFF
jgi:hypothetical protein